VRDGRTVALGPAIGRRGRSSPRAGLRRGGRRQQRRRQLLGAVRRRQISAKASLLHKTGWPTSRQITRYASKPSGERGSLPSDAACARQQPSGGPLSERRRRCVQPMERTETPSRRAGGPSFGRNPSPGPLLPPEKSMRAMALVRNRVNNTGEQHGGLGGSSGREPRA